MKTQGNKRNFSIIFKEVDKLSIEPDLMMSGPEITEYDEIRVLSEILLDTQPSPCIYYTGD